MYEELVGKKIRHITVKGEAHDAVVVAIDIDKGITIDTLEPERLEKLNYFFGKDFHITCINREAIYPEHNYVTVFNFAIKAIEAGTYDAGEKMKKFDNGLGGGFAACAFG